MTTFIYYVRVNDECEPPAEYRAIGSKRVYPVAPWTASLTSCLVFEGRHRVSPPESPVLHPHLILCSNFNTSPTPVSHCRSSSVPRNWWLLCSPSWSRFPRRWAERTRGGGGGCWGTLRARPLWRCTSREPTPGRRRRCACAATPRPSARAQAGNGAWPRRSASPADVLRRKAHRTLKLTQYKKLVTATAVEDEHLQ